MVRVLLTFNHAYIAVGKNVYKRTMREFMYGIAKPHKAEYKIHELSPLDDDSDLEFVYYAEYPTDRKVNSSEAVLNSFNAFWSKEVE